MMNDILKFENGNGVWFTSDTHFAHANIIKYCKRPFVNTQEMDAELIRRWNERVKPNDTVFHLGDFSWGGAQAWNDVLDQLHGKIHLILGNHDVPNINKPYMNRFASVSFQKQITIGKRIINLNHYPFLCYAGSYRENNYVYQLFGHVHTTKEMKDINKMDDEEVKIILGNDGGRLKYLLPTQYDVGVDYNDYAPISWDEVEEKIGKQVELFKAKQLC